MSKSYLLLAVGMLSIALSSEGRGGTPAAPTEATSTSVASGAVTRRAAFRATAFVGQPGSVDRRRQSSGMVTGIAPGRGTVQVMFRGHTASRQLEVVH